MGSELSEYERQRLENIRQNQAILKSLNIKSVVPEELKRAPIKTTAKAPRPKRPAPAVDESALLARRSSSRLRNRTLGLEGLDEDFVKIEPEAVAPRSPPRPRRIVGRIPFDPEEGATEGFLESTGKCSHKSAHAYAPSRKVEGVVSSLEIQNEHSVVKVMRERIYSVAIHPDPTRVLVAAGGKFGELAFLDATETSHPAGLANRVLPEPEDYSPKLFLFKPHTGSISNLRYNPVNSTQLLSTAYDNIVRCMDITKGCFDEMYNFGEDTGHVITGFDCSSDANVVYLSDTDGMFRWGDRRTGRPLEELRLHEKKIGCVSVAGDGRFLATASNDGTIGIWDLRMLGTKGAGTLEAVHTLPFRRSVTSVYFHPTDASRLLSTCYDDHVRIHYNVSGAEGELREAAMTHNNQTGRWITNFKAVWDPKTRLAVVGNMNRGIDVIDGDSGEIVRNITSDFLTAQPAVNAFHPHLDVIASGNASGKVAIWTHHD